MTDTFCDYTVEKLLEGFFGLSGSLSPPSVTTTEQQLSLIYWTFIDLSELVILFHGSN